MMFMLFKHVVPALAPLQAAALPAYRTLPTQILVLTALPFGVISAAASVSEPPERGTYRVRDHTRVTSHKVVSGAGRLQRHQVVEIVGGEEHRTAALVQEGQHHVHERL